MTLVWFVAILTLVVISSFWADLISKNDKYDDKDGFF